MSDNTIAALFDLAIATEKKAGDFYVGLAKKFRSVADISEFWEGMAKDEAVHARILEDLRSSLTPEQLHAHADDVILLKARAVSGFSAEDKLKQIRILDEAYEAAHELEYSEANIVFKFLTTKFMGSEEREKFLFLEIDKHVMKMMSFPERFGNREKRRSLAAEG